MKNTTKAGQDLPIGFVDSVDDLDRLRAEPAALQAELLRMGALDDILQDGTAIEDGKVDNYEVCTPMWHNDPAVTSLPENQRPDPDQG